VSKPEALRGAVARVLQEMEAGSSGADLRILKLWPRAVGPELAARCRPVDFRKGKLTVEADGAAWVQQLTLLAPHVLESVNRALGETLVTKLHLRQSRGAPALPAEPAPFPTAWSREPLPEAIRREFEAECAESEDPELREAILHARVMAEKRTRLRARLEGAAPPPRTSLRRRSSRGE